MANTKDEVQTIIMVDREKKKEFKSILIRLNLTMKNVFNDYIDKIIDKYSKDKIKE